MLNCSCGGGYIRGDNGRCQACEVGLYRSLDMLACAPCPNNTYSGFEPGAYRCTPCHANSFGPAGIINSSQCLCLPGYTFNDQPAGTEGNSTSPGGNSTSPGGNSSSPGVNSTSSSPCAPCGPGKYKAVAGPESCTLCPSGLKTLSIIHADKI